MTKTSGTNNYNSKIGFNLYPFGSGKMTAIVLFYPPEMSNIKVTAEAITARIHKQTSINFETYAMLMTLIDNGSRETPDYLFIRLQGAASVSNPQGYLQMVGVRGFVDHVNSDVFDQPYLHKNGKLQMKTDIDMNGYSINVPFFITGYYKKSESSNRIFLNNVSTYQIIPYNCIENVCYFYTPNNKDSLIKFKC